MQWAHGGWLAVMMSQHPSQWTQQIQWSHLRQWHWPDNNGHRLLPYISNSPRHDVLLSAIGRLLLPALDLVDSITASASVPSDFVARYKCCYYYHLLHADVWSASSLTTFRSKLKTQFSFISAILLVMARYSHKGHDTIQYHTKYRDTIRYDPKVLHCM